MKVIKYGLLHKKTNELVKYSARATADDADFCGDTVTELNLYSESEWLVASPEQAEYVRHTPTEWYNADYGTPDHSFDLKSCA